MKTVKILSICMTLALVFSSCTSNESLLSESSKSDLLKSYKVKRDATGAYSIDFDVEDHVKSEKVINALTNRNEFHLYETDFSSPKSQTEELFIDGNKLSIGFIDTNSGNNSNISIEDDNIFFAKSSAKKANMLKEYSISNNEDGTFNLDFTVNPTVSVDFSYNDEQGIYEVHLRDGKSATTSYSRNLSIEDGAVLRIDFVNHLSNGNSSEKAYASKEEETIKRKPRIVIDNGESNEG